MRRVREGTTEWKLFARTVENQIMAPTMQRLYLSGTALSEHAPEATGPGGCAHPEEQVGVREEILPSAVDEVMRKTECVTLKWEAMVSPLATMLKKGKFAKVVSATTSIIYDASFLVSTSVRDSEDGQPIQFFPGIAPFPYLLRAQAMLHRASTLTGNTPVNMLNPSVLPAKAKPVLEAAIRDCTDALKLINLNSSCELKRYEEAKGESLKTRGYAALALGSHSAAFQDLRAVVAKRLRAGLGSWDGSGSSADPMPVEMLLNATAGMKMGCPRPH